MRILALLILTHLTDVATTHTVQTRIDLGGIIANNNITAGTDRLIEGCLWLNNMMQQDLGCAFGSIQGVEIVLVHLRQAKRQRIITLVMTGTIWLNK